MPLYSQLWFITAEKDRLKSAKEKSTWAKSKKRQAKVLSCSSQWSCIAMHLIPQTLICHNMCKVLPTREAHLRLDVQQFLMGVIQMTGLGYSDSSSLPIFQA